MIIKYNIYINKYMLFRCIKTLTPNLGRKTSVRSELKSRLRGPVFLEKCRRVTSHMARLTKLSHHVCLILGLNYTTGIRFCKPWHPTRMYWVSGVIGLRHNHRLIFMVQRPKCGLSGSWGTMGHPKGRKPYGGGDSVRESGFKRFSSFTNINEQSCVGLKDLIEINRNNVDLVNNKLIHIVADSKVLILAYEIIKSKLGNMTPGINSTTLDKIDLDWIETVSQLLKAGKYKFNPARRVYIPKPGKKGERSPTICSLRDKVVQQAIYLVLNAIYEPSFINSSHGSRPKRNAHTALKDVKYKFQGVKWCIKAGIESNLPNIDHKILLTFLGKRIRCHKFLALIKRSLKAGYMEDEKIFACNKGLFQRNITSPILNNIYLHQLDLFMFNLAKSFNKGKNRRKSTIFRRIQYQMKKSTEDTSKLEKLRKELWKVNSKDLFDPNFKRLYYVRYVDDFVVGVVGSYQATLEIRDKIDVFLRNELRLTLSSEKTFITHFSKKPIFFLGTFIRGSWKRDKTLITIKKNNSTSRKGSMTSKVVLNAPIKSIFEKATLNGFFKVHQGQFIPTKVGRCINFDHQDILRYYNSVIRGVLNYYSFANNRKSLGRFVHGLKLSCARTLALKYKLRHASKIYKKFGPKLRSPDGSIELFIPSTFKAIKKFSCSVPITDDAILNNWNNKLTKSNLFKQCILCDSSDHRQVHHIRKVKDLKSKDKRKS
uniref:hypothetical protein n=1 Tax=Cocconeiopsis kantsiensis TaxID=3082010 RepID=UPI003001AD1D